MKPRGYVYGTIVILIIVIIITVILYNKNTIIKSHRPNIVVIIADDMGWNDVSYHGSDQIMTPNIDLLAYSGVALERYYTHCVCTPSRSALYTGKFAYTLGMQGLPLTNGEDRGIPLEEKILPQYLKSLGYATHLVGKWHVGHSRKVFLPTFRGFDTRFGHRTGFIDYYEYFLDILTAVGDISGLDLYRNLNPDWNSNKYVTDLYTEEALSVIKSHNSKVPLFLTVAHNAPHASNQGGFLQAPPEEVRAMRHIASAQRRIYAAMVKKLDDSVGDIVKALYDKRILDNTIIVFVSDNGGITSGKFKNYASNWPLRGLKITPFEGGIRVNGLIWTKNLTNANNHVWNGYMHVVDWVPTLLKAVGAKPPIGIDGLDLWENITSNTASKREVMFEIDDFSDFASITAGDFKLITGNISKNMGNHQGENLRGIIGSAPSYVDTLKKSRMYTTLKEFGINIPLEDIHIRNRTKINCNKKTKCDLCYPDKSKGKLCLFNIKEDPCEMRDISRNYPHIVENMNTRLQAEIKRMIPRKPGFIQFDPRADPSSRILCRPIPAASSLHLFLPKMDCMSVCYFILIKQKLLGINVSYVAFLGFSTCPVANNELFIVLINVMEDISMDINFDSIFKIMIFGMRVNRSHPDTPRDKKWIFQFMTMHGIFFFVFCLLIYSTVAYDLKKNDFSQACSNGILSVIFCVVTYKYCVMLNYQHLLKGLMDEMRVDYERAKTLPTEEQAVVLSYAKRGKKVVNIWILISIITGGLFPAKTLILMAYYSIKGEFKLVHLYDLTYPSPLEERKNELPVYFLLYVLFLFYDGYAMVMYIAMAALGPIFMLHGCAQLELVRRRIMNVFNKNDSEKSTLIGLNEIVKELQKIYRFLERVQESFKILYELTLKATAIILPICFYQVIESFNKGELKIEFITVIIGAIALSSIPCYYSDELMNMGENLRLAVYFCGWEGYLDRHKTLRNTLLLLQSRAARPIAVRAMFRTVSLDALTDVYHQSYAIFNVLNAAWK